MVDHVLIFFLIKMSHDNTNEKLNKIKSINIVKKKNKIVDTWNSPKPYKQLLDIMQFSNYFDLFKLLIQDI